MDFSSSTVIYISIIIIIVCIFYVCYIMYNDISTLKIKIDALQSNIASLTLAQNSANNNYQSSSPRKKDLEGGEECSDTEDDTDTEGESEDGSDDSEDDGGNIVERHSNDNGEWLQHSIYDQFLIDPSQLHHLQQLQQEIQGDRLETIHELDEEADTDTESGGESAGKDSAKKPKNNAVVGEIKFISDAQKKYCPKLLKSGKNKGLSCGKEANPESGFCKIHSNSE